MKDRISIDVHPCTKVDPDCATDQMAIYLDDDSLIGYASNIENGCISLIMPFEDEDVSLIHEAVSKLIGVTHTSVGVIPDVPDDMLEDIYNDDLTEDMGSLTDDDSE